MHKIRFHSSRGLAILYQAIAIGGVLEPFCELEACRICGSAACCQTAPVLCPDDLEAIARATHLASEDFAECRNHPETGRALHYLKTLKDGHCMFLDPTTRQCGIYNARPLDCRLFPLDVVRIGQDLFLVYHNLPDCHLSTEEITRLQRFAEESFRPRFRNLLQEYATLTTPGHSSDIVLIKEINR